MPSKIRMSLQIGPRRWIGARQIVANLVDHAGRNWSANNAHKVVEVLGAQGTPLYKRIQAALKISPDANLRLHMWRERPGLSLRESRFKRFLRDAGIPGPHREAQVAGEAGGILVIPPPNRARRRDVPRMWNGLPVALEQDGRLYYRAPGGHLQVIPGPGWRRREVPPVPVDPVFGVRIGIFK